MVKSFQLEERSSGSGKTEDVWFLDLFRREPNSGAVCSVCCCWFIWYVLVSKFGANLVVFSLLICLWFRNSAVESLAISSLFLIRVSIKCSLKCVDINMIWSGTTEPQGDWLSYCRFQSWKFHDRKMSVDDMWGIAQFFEAWGILAPFCEWRNLQQWWTLLCHFCRYLAQRWLS